MLHSNPLHKIFNGYLQELSQSFPELAGRLILSDATDDENYQSLNSWQDMGLPSKEELDFQVAKKAGFARDFRTSISDTITKYNLQIITIFNHLALTPDGDMNILHELDHEAGHLLIPGADEDADEQPLSVSNFGEAAADVYECIRHFQRFGVADSPLQTLAHTRALSYIAGEGAIHLTTFPLLALDRLKNKIDFSKITPQQTITLAQRIAQEFALSESLSKKLKSEFKHIFSTLPEDATREDLATAFATLALDPRAHIRARLLALSALHPYIDGKEPPLLNPDKIRQLKRLNLRLPLEGVYIGDMPERKINAAAKTAVKIR